MGFLLFIIGAIFGSFVNVIIYRIPKNISLLYPPSSCVKCGERLRWYENVPIISYLLLQGKCRHCGSQFSISYPTIEVLVGEDEKLFGSVTSGDIAEMLEKESVIVDKRAIELENPIKVLGVYAVPVKIDKDVTANLKLWVIKKT